MKVFSLEERSILITRLFCNLCLRSSSLRSPQKKHLQTFSPHFFAALLLCTTFLISGTTPAVLHIMEPKTWTNLMLFALSEFITSRKPNQKTAWSNPIFRMILVSFLLCTNGNGNTNKTRLHLTIMDQNFKRFKFWRNNWVLASEKRT